MLKLKDAAPAIETERLFRPLLSAFCTRKRPKEATGVLKALQRTNRLGVKSALRRPKNNT
jgi:hypothetical protein